MVMSFALIEENSWILSSVKKKFLFNKTKQCKKELFNEFFV